MNVDRYLYLFHKLVLTVACLSTVQSHAQHIDNQMPAWNPDNGATYRNPVINADYSDPDVCRVGNDYYMTASSFACFPGLPILHSTDLVNWTIIGHALQEDYPVLDEYVGTDLDWNSNIQHGNYVWAPAIRYHDGWFYIFWGDPDQGLFMTKTHDPAGRWERAVLVKKGKGMIDCCPLWDDDGNAYISHGCAGSRAGVKSVLFVAPMAADGTHVTGPSRIVYDGHWSQPTIEGTKFYRRGGYYYIMAPAGGVKYGWQTELRSRCPYGPYKEHVGLAQGSSEINGPHQGAWVDTQNGEDWFLHFQDKHAYGRVVHLQPAKWVDDWLVIGDDRDGDGCGEPVCEWKKPELPSTGVFQPQTNDEFDSVELGRQWQFEGPISHYWYFCDAAGSRLRLYGAQVPENYRNLSDLQNVLLQKFPAESFTATAKIRFTPNPAFKPRGEEGGFTVMGQDYAAVKFVSVDNGCVMRFVTCKGAHNGGLEQCLEEVSMPLTSDPQPYTQKYAVDDIPQPRLSTQDVYVRVKVWSTGVGNEIRAHASFSYSLDGSKFIHLGQFSPKEGKWIGAKMGFFCLRPSFMNDAAFLDIDWISVGKSE